MAALRGAHADGGEALDQLHVAVAVAGGVDDVTHLQVFVEVDEILAFRVREDRPGEVDPRLGWQLAQWLTGFQAESGECAQGAVGGIGEQRVEGCLLYTSV